MFESEEIQKLNKSFVKLEELVQCSLAAEFETKRI